MKRVFFVSVLLFLFAESSQGADVPRITDGCNTQVSLKPEDNASIDVDARGDNCDTLIWSLGAITPNPNGTVTISQRGLVRFASAATDSGLYTVEVIVRNEIGAADSCTVSFNVFVPVPYRIRIEKTHNTIMGQSEQIDVTLQQGSAAFTGFDLLIAYNDSLMDLLDVLPGTALFSDSGCQWEHFDFQAYPNGMVRVIGRPKSAHADCRADCLTAQSLPLKLFTLDFMVGEDRCQSDCAFHPIRFVWLSCDDNTISQENESAPFISRNIFNYDWPDVNIADSSSDVYPTFLGAQQCSGIDTCKTDPVRFIDFYNGGIDMVCADWFPTLGDMNLNEIPFELTDVDLYAEYFLRGLDVFRINQAGQIAMSDVNNDSTMLTVADLAFMTNIIANNLPIPEYPCHPITPPTIDMKYLFCNGVVAVDRPIGAALLVAEGNVTPGKMAKWMTMRYFFDGTNTRILLYTNPLSAPKYPFWGDIVNGIDNLISAEFGSLAGGMVNAIRETPCDSEPLRLSIEHKKDVMQGLKTTVDVTLESGKREIGGFDLVIAFDADALQITDIIEGAAFYHDTVGCAWEYFSYRYTEFGECGTACASGKVRVVGVTDTNIGPGYYPTCRIPFTLPSVLFTLEFLVTDNRTYQCAFLPINFVWFDCQDNAISSRLGDSVYISRYVYSVKGDSSIADSTGTYPTWNGAQICEGQNSSSYSLHREVDFKHGGIQLYRGYCLPQCIYGDINLNEISFETSDFNLFVDYFLKGLSVFAINTQGQIASTDINNDSLTLTVADLAYLSYIIRNPNEYPDNPCDVVAPTPIEATYGICDGIVSINKPMGAAYLVAEGNVVPKKLARRMVMHYFFDGQNTRILMYSDPNNTTAYSFDGEFVAGIGTLISAEFGTLTGGMVNATMEPPCDTTPFKVRIEKKHNVIQGQHTSVDVVLEQAARQMGGYDFMISYDASALQVTGVMPGPDWFDNTVDAIGCEWEYFAYRLHPFGDCGNACASGKVRVVAIAETNVCCHHPNCLVPNSFPSVLFTIDFLMSDNRTYECLFLPLQFVWSDCGDNGIVNEIGDKLYISNNVYNLESENIADSNGTYPTWNGAQRCANTPGSNPLIRRIDFYSGGIDVSCPGIFDVPGDINLNDISNEVADGVLFSDYFLYGLSVFTVDVEEQKAATDVNADGIMLSLADLVYHARVVIGDASPYPKTSPTIEANYTVANGKISIDSTVAAAVIVVAGNVTPKLLAPNMDMRYAFDGTNTHVLVYTNIENSMTIETFTGTFVTVNGTVLSVEFATPQGGMVTASQSTGKLQDFILGQNYPNPFNQTTRISFSLPQATDYTLCIYNISGQKVFESQGRGTAGINAVEWTATHEASGIYFYKLTSGNISETKKMIFLK